MSRLGHDDITQIFDPLFDTHYQEIYRYCLRRVGPTEAEDAAAEVFATAWRRIGEMPQVGNQRAWLYGVAHRVVANQYRARRRREGLTRKLAQQAGPADQAQVADPDPALHTALALLSAADQELLRLASWDGLTRDEIAHVLGIRENAVDQRLHRARARLRDKYTRLGTEMPKATPTEATS